MTSPKLSSAQFVKMNYLFLIHLVIEENVNDRRCRTCGPIRVTELSRTTV